MQTETIATSGVYFQPDLIGGIACETPLEVGGQDRVSHTRVSFFGRDALDRRAYRHLLEDEFDLEIVQESDFESAGVWAAVACKPGLAVVSDDTPSGAGTDTLRAVQLISEQLPHTRIVVIGSTSHPRFVELWSEQKIASYLTRHDGIDGLRIALEAVVAGRRFLGEHARAATEGGFPRGTRYLPLSRRERELLELLAKGRKLREAAVEMSISYKTADAHRTRLMQKLGIHDRVELVRYAIREKIIEA